VQAKTVRVGHDGEESRKRFVEHTSGTRDAQHVNGLCSRRVQVSDQHKRVRMAHPQATILFQRRVDEELEKTSADEKEVSNG
jgi:hypothetical protein